MLAGTIGTPTSQAVHRLGTALRGALLVGMSIWASNAIVGRVCADGIVSAAPVLVVLAVMEARAVGTPVSNTVHRLATGFSCTFNLVMREWAFLSIEKRCCSNLVGSAALVLVTISNMIAATVLAPLTNAVHRLPATILCALLELVGMRTSIPIVQSKLTDGIQSTLSRNITIISFMLRAQRTFE